eukprot:Phypoly_transcript_20089.p1 GENE.Phypoly_transcript_20089~~Phypoly_transcript_20089.p1  ORF type:complete len:147 (+),score=28.01 Phypoly_transcript_20089:240-680(+)
MVIPPILAPVVSLVIWTLVIEAWMFTVRIPATIRLKLKYDPDTIWENFYAKLPPSVRWKSDNHNHLMQQPTLFYALALTLALADACGGAGAGAGLNASLAWMYVALRVVHSLVQVTANIIMLRFTLFISSSIVLAIIAFRSAYVVF